ncbi:MAG: FAD-dependent oxidoreductase [bacterium]
MSALSRKPEPEKAVLLVGSGYGALKTAEDLAASGIPVVWVTRANHFLEVPGGIGSFEEWPEDINFQFRPLYLRVTRHPLVTPLTRAGIESFQPDKNGYKVVVRQDPEYVDYDLCTGCGRCMEICPLSESALPPLTRTPAYCPSRALELDKRTTSPCRIACPLGVNAQAYLALTAAGRFSEALAVIKKDNPLPGVCGRVCHHPCEAECRRADLDQAVAIRDVKRFLADYEAEHGTIGIEKPAHLRRSERVAVIGSGPAGLTAAHFLNQQGFQVTVFESMEQAGGMLRAGINAFRLPRKVLDLEIQALADSGITLKTGTTVSSPDQLFKKGYKAVALCTGTHCDLSLGIPGEDLAGVKQCVKFLSGVNLAGEGDAGGGTLVIGGGNSAMDAARTALRLGSAEVVVAAIEKEDDLPAHPREAREAEEEGVIFKLGLAPVAIEGDGKVEKVLFKPAHWEFPENGPPRIEFDSDETVSVRADSVIVAIGQKPHLAECGLDQCVELGKGGRIKTNEKCETSQKGVFAAGDVVTGPSTVIDAMASGRELAGRIHTYLTRKPAPFIDRTMPERGVGDPVEISEDMLKEKRQELRQRQPKVRRRDFDEVDFGYSDQQARSESLRCLQCGGCCECRICEQECEEIKAIDHFRQATRGEFISPCVVVADMDEAPEELREEQEAVFPMTQLRETTNLMDVLVAGSAAAGKAMARAASIRQRTSPETSEEPPEWTTNPRLGVFLCSCNHTIATPDVMERLAEFAGSVPGVVHSEVLPSVCHPQGADRIAKKVKTRNLDRVIVASCICCPLQFHCISCNDQRTRAKIHLFEDHKLNPAGFEMINLRDQISAGEGQSEGEIFDRARDILRGAFVRARFMGPLRQGYTEIGKRILILGASELGLSCAYNLDLQGFKVRLVHDCTVGGEDKTSKKPASNEDLGKGKSITHVPEAVIEDIRGHMGDFTVMARLDGKRRRWKADMVCLTEESVLPLAVHEDMSGLKKLYRYDFAFFHTPQLGLYRVLPRTLKRVPATGAGAALASQVATAAAEAFLKDHELSPIVDKERCRGCGRCAEICPFDAIRMSPTQEGIYTAEVLRYNCVGCGGCVGRCPVMAMDIPYFSNELLTEIVKETLAGER